MRNCWLLHDQVSGHLSCCGSWWFLGWGYYYCLLQNFLFCFIFTWKWEYFWKQKCLRFWTGACRQQAPLPPCLQFVGSSGCLAYGLLPSVMLLQFHLQFPRKAACLLHHPLSWVRAGLRQEMGMLLVRAHISIPFVSSWGHFPPDLSFDAKADPKAD